MKPNPLMAAIFAIILLLTFVVMLRAAVGAPEIHEDAPHEVEEAHDESGEKGVVEESHEESSLEEDKASVEEQPAH